MTSPKGSAVYAHLGGDSQWFEQNKSLCVYFGCGIFRGEKMLYYINDNVQFYIQQVLIIIVININLKFSTIKKYIIHSNDSTVCTPEQSTSFARLSRKIENYINHTHVWYAQIKREKFFKLTLFERKFFWCNNPKLVFIYESDIYKPLSYTQSELRFSWWSILYFSNL